MSKSKRFWEAIQERLEREIDEEVSLETVDEAVADFCAKQADYLKDLAREGGTWYYTTQSTARFMNDERGQG